MIELVTGADGTAHVSSADDGALFSTIVGTGSYVGKGLGDGLTLSIKDNNHLTLGVGTGWHNGRGFRVVSQEDVVVQSGAQAQRRADLVVARYSMSDDRESMSIVTIKGEPVADSAVPEYPAHEGGSVLEGAAVSDFPLYGVKLNGLQIESTERLFTTVPSLTDLMGLMEAVQVSIKAIEAKNASQDKAIDGKAASSHGHAAATQGANGFMSAGDKKKLDGVAAGANAYSLPTATGSVKGGVKLSDSTTSTSAAGSGVAATPAAVKAVRDLVDRQPTIRIGTISAHGTVDTSFRLLTKAQYKSAVGREFDPNRDMVAAMNADESAGKFTVLGTFANGGDIWASVDSKTTGWYRINYLIVAGK